MIVSKITNATGELEKIEKINELASAVDLIYGATKQVYEFVINTAESDPTAAVSYAGMNKYYTPASMNFTTGKIDYGSWEKAFFQPRPVMVKYDGTVDYELDKNDFTKKLDGTASDVSNTSYGGNCMIAFPQVWMKFVEDDSTHQHVYIANYQADNNYHCYTHQNKNGDWLDEIFINAFEPSNIDNKLRSLAEQTVFYNISATTSRGYTQANGTSWDFMDYGELQMLQMLFVLMFKSVDSQTKAGAGIVKGSATSYTTTGAIKDKGMFYAICNNATSSNATTPIKVFGIENLWGNFNKYINGLVSIGSASGSSIKYKLCDCTTDGTTETSYTDTGTGYKTLTTGQTTLKYGFSNKMFLNSDGLFASPDYIDGSGTTYYCDEVSFEGRTDSSNAFAQFGGYYDDASSAGLFNIYLMVSSNTSWDTWNNYYAPTLSCKKI